MGIPSSDSAQTGYGNASSNDRHLGRDAAIGGGLGAAGLGAYEASKKHDTINSAFGTQSSSGSVSSGVPYNSSTTGSTSTSTAPHTGLAATDAKFRDEKDSHTGRNVALGGGAAAAGIGGYEAYKHHENKDGTHPSSTTGISSSASAPYNSTTSSTGETASRLRDNDDNHAGRNAALGGPSLDEKAAIATASSGQGGIGSESSELDGKSHHGRDAALIGGAGAAGLGGYEASKHHDHKDHTFGQTPASASVRADGVPVSSQQSTLTHNQKENTSMFSTTTDNQHHTGRDVAAVGAAGAAGAGAHHEYSKHEAEKAAKEQQKAEEKLAKEREHEAAKRHKEHEKDVAKHEKDAAKHEKEVEKEKKPSLISRILHRKKDKHGNDIDSEEEDTKHGHGKEAALGAGAVGTAGLTAHEHDERNKLHKDPPPGHPAHDTGRSTRTYFTTAAGPTLEERAEAVTAGTHPSGTAHISTEGSHRRV